MTPKEYFAIHGISKDSYVRFGLSLAKKDTQIVIPIKDKEGKVLFNKYRNLGEGQPKYTYDSGSHATLFNPEGLEGIDFVFLCEGEMDAIRLDQEGMPAVSFTSGASTFKEEWVDYFVDKKVYILYDNDEAGIEGAKKVKELLPKAIIITLPEGSKDVCEYLMDHTMEEFWEMFEEQRKGEQIGYKELCDVFDKWLLLPDKNVIKVLMATLVSHFLNTDPLWMFFVAPPSGSKTEIISAVSSLPFVYMLSDLTAQTFASGLKAKVDPSLLPKLSNHVLVMKDFTTVLTMRYEDRQMILSQLREIYDGRYSKAFGTGKVVDWQGRLTLICGVTTIIDTQSAIFQVMGERFVMYRIPQPNDIEMADKAQENYGSEKEMREALKQAVSKYFNSLVIPDIKDVKVPREIRDALNALASFVVKARSGVIREAYSKDLSYIPQAEAPTRFVKQLGVLMKSLAILEGRTEVQWKDYYLTLRVGIDVIPNNRTRHLAALCGKPNMETTTNIATSTQYSPAGSTMILEDLQAFGLVKVVRSGATSPTMWGLAQKTKDYFYKILPIWNDDLKTVFSEDDLYMPLLREMAVSIPSK